MEYRNIGKSDLKVSSIGLGAWQAGAQGWGKVYDRDVKDAIRTSIDMGLNFIDTAEAYGDGHSESVIGEAIKDIRDDIIIATKVSGNHLRPDLIERALDGSLKRLQTSYVDLYQIHWPDIYTPLKDTMKTLEKLVNNGKIRYIGLSNFSVCQMEEARSYLSTTDIVSNQVRYNLIQREIELEIMPYQNKENIGIIAYSPLAQGLLTSKYDHIVLDNNDVRKSNKLFNDQNLKAMEPMVKTLKDISSEIGKSIVQISINWLLNHDGVIPIPGAKNRDQAIINLQSSGWRLTQDHMKRIDDAYKLVVEKLDVF